MNDVLRENHSDGCNRERLRDAIGGEPVTMPVFAVYDWFVEHRSIDWSSLFALGLGQIMHADVIHYERPHLRIEESRSVVDGVERRDVNWVTDVGELHEYYLGEWRQEYLIKTPRDYVVMKRALADTAISATMEHFTRKEASAGDNGITIAQMDRTPFQRIQIDLAGLERFSMDLAVEQPELMELLELMNEQKLEEFRAIRTMPIEHIKLWENLSVETIGPLRYRRYLVPVYEKILGILEGSGKRLQVHYDGQLRAISEDIARLPFDGIDSLTPAPEGDMTIDEARRLWPDKFLWLHPSLTYYGMEEKPFADALRSMARQAGPCRYCMMISEDIPPNWIQTVPWALETLSEMDMESNRE